MGFYESVNIDSENEGWVFMDKRWVWQHFRLTIFLQFWLVGWD